MTAGLAFENFWRLASCAAATEILMMSDEFVVKLSDVKSFLLTNDLIVSHVTHALDESCNNDTYRDDM